MHIGILTLPFNNNYGGYLQAYALIRILKDLGHNVELINRRPNRQYRVRFIYTIKTVIKILIGKKHGPLFYDPEKNIKREGILMMKFVNQSIPRSKPYYTSQQLKNGCKNKYDAIVVGSDQVWRSIYVPNIEDFFLKFTKGQNLKRIAYAASFGTNAPEYTKKQILQCGKLITLFNAISVREKSGINVINKFNWKVQIKPHVTLDPTMLLSREDYLKLINKHLNENINHYIFSYVLDQSKTTKKIIESINNSMKLPIYDIFNTIDKDSSQTILPSIEHWLLSISESKFVITDSFHGTVFSIIFNKPFAVYINNYRGADRIESLLSLLNLENRIIKTQNDIETIIQNEITWKDINKRIINLQSKSLLFLKQSLKE